MKVCQEGYYLATRVLFCSRISTIGDNLHEDLEFVDDKFFSKNCPTKVVLKIDESSTIYFKNRGKLQPMTT